VRNESDQRREKKAFESPGGVKIQASSERGKEFVGSKHKRESRQDGRLEKPEMQRALEPNEVSIIDATGETEGNVEGWTNKDERGGDNHPVMKEGGVGEGSWRGLKSIVYMLFNEKPADCGPACWTCKVKKRRLRTVASQL